jgi:transcriptional regulator GlxA family with amidase domain
LAADSSKRRWCSLHLPSAELGTPTGDAQSAVDSTRGVIRLPLHRMVQFRSVIERLHEAVQRDPDTFSSARAQNAAWQKLIPEICSVLAVPQAGEPPLGRHPVPRTQIIQRAMRFIEQHDGEYLSVGRLAASAGVSERTLREAFQQYFGAGPVQYLNRRTLHQVRKALKSADPSVATVTKIAAGFGVWQLVL